MLFLKQLRIVPTVSIFTQLHRSGFNRLRTCMSQSGMLLLIFGREKAKLVVASKTALILFPSNVKIK